MCDVGREKKTATTAKPPFHRENSPETAVNWRGSCIDSCDHPFCTQKFQVQKSLQLFLVCFPAFIGRSICLTYCKLFPVFPNWIATRHCYRSIVQLWYWHNVKCCLRSFDRWSFKHWTLCSQTPQLTKDEYQLYYSFRFASCLVIVNCRQTCIVYQHRMMTMQITGMRGKFLFGLHTIVNFSCPDADNWRAQWKNRTCRYISFCSPSLSGVLLTIFCLLVEGEHQILVF